MIMELWNCGALDQGLRTWWRRRWHHACVRICGWSSGAPSPPGADLLMRLSDVASCAQSCDEPEPRQQGPRSGLPWPKPRVPSCAPSCCRRRRGTASAAREPPRFVAEPRLGLRQKRAWPLGRRCCRYSGSRRCIFALPRLRGRRRGDRPGTCARPWLGLTPVVPLLYGGLERGRLASEPRRRRPGLGCRGAPRRGVGVAPTFDGSLFAAPAS
mmetsp:Transcript_41525/g.90514  ORF Transcript_41525/g.90514 Transcript_41525/m.90514 type:complete len:213 (+) Transcript_41525:579-1217(+)